MKKLCGVTTTAVALAAVLCSCPAIAGVEKTGTAFNPPDTAKEETAVIRAGETLSLKRCVDLALARQPAIVAAMRSAEAIEQRVGQAKASYYPQISLGGGYSRISPAGSRSSSYSGGNYNQYSAELSLTQNIYDFGKTDAAVASGRLQASAARADLDDLYARIVFSVKQAYYVLLQSGKNKGVAEEAVRQYQQHLDQARGFFEVGSKSRYDVTTAEVNLSNARLNLIKADNAQRVAVVVLNNAMGLPGASGYGIEDDLAFRKHETTLEAALAQAMANRSDLIAAQRRRQAAEQSLLHARSGDSPAITGSASVGRQGEDFLEDSGWSVGAAISFPLFDGYLTRQQVAEARSNLLVAEANENLAKQTIFLDVQQAFLALTEAENRIPVAEITVKMAAENLAIAHGRYAAGVGNPIEVTDAQVGHANAKTALIQALADYKVAQASLEKAMGVNSP